MTALALIAVALYALASWRLAGDGRLVDAGPRNGRRSVGLLLGALAVLFHLGLHAKAWHTAGGVDLGFFSALSLVSLGMAALSTLFAWTRRFEALGGLVYPLAALGVAAYALAGPHPAAALDWPLQLHALLALLAYVTLAVAVLLAVMLWAQDRALRGRRLDSPMLRLLPPLTELESLVFRTIAAGFVLLSFALVTGVLFVDDLLAQHLVHKTVLSVLSWLVFGFLLYGRARYGWRGRRAAHLAIGAMALLLLAFFGSKFVLELILHRA
ncbi:MAG: cytochrome c biogenesis protein CcsA [Lysobacteraceae bacterium]